MRLIFIAVRRRLRRRVTRPRVVATSPARTRRLRAPSSAWVGARLLRRREPSGAADRRPDAVLRNSMVSWATGRGTLPLGAWGLNGGGDRALRTAGQSDQAGRRTMAIP